MTGPEGTTLNEKRPAHISFFFLIMIDSINVKSWLILVFWVRAVTAHCTTSDDRPNFKGVWGRTHFLLFFFPFSFVVCVLGPKLNKEQSKGVEWIERRWVQIKESASLFFPRWIFRYGSLQASTYDEMSVNLKTVSRHRLVLVRSILYR